MTGKVKFVYKLEGDFVDGIDFFQLCSFVNSVTNLIQESNKILGVYPGEILFNIKPIQSGSIITELQLHSGNLITQTQTLFGGFDSNIKELLSVIGLMAPHGENISKTLDGATSLFDLFKKLKGERPEAIKKPDGTYDLRTDSNTVNVSQRIYALFGSTTVHNHIHNGLIRPVKSGISEGVSTNCDNSEPLIIDKELANNIYNLTQKEVKEYDYTEVRTQIRIEAFAEERLDWKFTYPVKKGYMKVTDIEFWEKYKREEINIFLGDKMDCDVRSKADTYSGEVVEQEVIKVYDIIPSKKKEKLF